MEKLPEQEDMYDVTATSLTPVQTSLQYADIETPEVKYTQKAWNKIQHVIEVCPKEVGWFGTVQEVDTGYLITDIFVPKQIVTGAETDIKAEDLADIAMLVEDPEELYYWGHSHVNMGVSPSTQDEEQLTEYLNHSRIFIRGIYNKKGASKVDVVDTEYMVVHQAVRNTVQVPQLSTEDLAELTTALKQVKERIVPPKKGGFKYYGAPAKKDQPAEDIEYELYEGWDDYLDKTVNKDNPFILGNYM